jgi:hypothetical protein
MLQKLRRNDGRRSCFTVTGPAKQYFSAGCSAVLTLDNPAADRVSTSTRGTELNPIAHTTRWFSSTADASPGGAPARLVGPELVVVRPDRVSDFDRSVRGIHSRHRWNRVRRH